MAELPNLLAWITFLPLLAGLGLIAANGAARGLGADGLPEAVWKAFGLAATALTFLLSLVLWYGGPYLAFGSMRPLDTVTERLVAIGLLIVLIVLWTVLGKLKAKRAANQLAKDMTAGAEKQSKGAQDAAQLRARFDEALGALRESKGKSVSLYELPWYIIIGPPGAGKTTVIANSGLNFPLSKKFGKEALRGVGGTRNCDWWFTDEAILLDTAGRYTTQDSDSEADQSGWIEFLNLLRKHRGRRPINGVIVAISASDLLSMSDHDRRRHVEAVRRRLEEVLAAIEKGQLDPETLRHQRAVAVLERIGSKEARSLLKRLAEGAPGAEQTREAGAALERLRQR